MAPKIEPFDSPIGAAVTSVDLSLPMTPENFKILLDAWNEYSVLVFRDQELQPELPSTELLEKAKLAGISQKTLDRAKKECDFVRSYKKENSWYTSKIAKMVNDGP